MTLDFITIEGTSGNDELTGGISKEVINGLGGHDRLSGGDGTDQLSGGAGNDLLYGDNGDDVLYSGAGNDILRGGPGYDHFAERESSGNDQFFGEDGFATFSIFRQGEGPGSEILIDAGRESGWVNFGALGRQNDKVAIIGADQATPNGDLIQIEGGAAATVDAGHGDDDIVLGTVTGSNAITLGGGRDTLIMREPGASTGLVTVADFEPGTGGDQLVIDGFPPTRLVQQGSDVAVQVIPVLIDEDLPYATLVVIRNALVANIKYDSYYNYYYHSVAAGAETEGNDVLAGTAAANGLDGFGGNDLIYGLDGNDAINGGAGADRMVGGLGDDLFTVDDVADIVFENSRQGNDTVRTKLGYTLPDHVENLVMTGGGNVNGTGNALANAIAGNDGNNRINGRGGADSLAGGKGHDLYVVDHGGDQVLEAGSSGNDTVESSVSFKLPTHVEKLVLTGTSGIDGRGNSAANTITGNAGGNFLNGNGGNDIIDAGGGNDRVLGGAGNDSLKGGAGLDRFEFTTALGATNVDRILDYSVADDTIQLMRSIFTQAGPNGTLAASAFHIGTSAADAGDRIVFDTSTQRIYYDPDGTGPAAQILFATVTAGTALTNADFVIFG